MFYCTIFVTGVQQNNLGHYLCNFSIFLLHDLWMCVGGSHKFISGKVQRSSLISGWGEQGGSYPEYPHLESINKICIQWTFSLQIKTAYCVSFFFNMSHIVSWYSLFLSQNWPDMTELSNPLFSFMWSHRAPKSHYYGASLPFDVGHSMDVICREASMTTIAGPGLTLTFFFFLNNPDSSQATICLFLCAHQLSGVWFS